MSVNLQDVVKSISTSFCSTNSFGKVLVDERLTFTCRALFVVAIGLRKLMAAMWSHFVNIYLWDTIVFQKKTHLLSQVPNWISSTPQHHASHPT